MDINKRGPKPKLGSTRPPKIDPRFAKPKVAPKIKAPKEQVPMWVKPSVFRALDALAQMDGRNRTNYFERLITVEAKRQGIELDETLDFLPDEQPEL